MALRSLMFLMTIFVLTTAAALKEPEKSTDGDVEIKDKFDDDHKRNLSDEVVMFGNQQNKAAGMIDDALVEGLKENDNTANENKDETLHNKLEKRVPIVSESGIEPDKSKESSEDNSEVEDMNLKMINDYISSSSSENDNDPVVNDQDIAYEDMFGLGNTQGWPQYSDLFDNNYHRFRRNTINHQRDIRASLDQLLNGDGTGRSKRDLHLSDEDILNLLEYMPYDPRIQDAITMNMEKESALNDFPEEPFLTRDYENPTLENSHWDLYEKMLLDNIDLASSEDTRENQEWPFEGLSPYYTSQASNFFPSMDYSDLVDSNDEQPSWEPLQERFMKRRLQSSEEDDENSQTINENQSDVWPNGDDLNEIYRRLVW